MWNQGELNKHTYPVSNWFELSTPFEQPASNICLINLQIFITSTGAYALLRTLGILTASFIIKNSSSCLLEIVYLGWMFCFVSARHHYIVTRETPVLHATPSRLFVLAGCILISSRSPLQVCMQQLISILLIFVRTLPHQFWCWQRIVASFLVLSHGLSS